MKGKLGREKLAQVVGGTAQEMAELQEAVLGNPHLKPIWDKYMAEYGDEFDAAAWAVTEALDLGFTASGGSSHNIYDYNASHEQVLGWLKKYPDW